jgi:hypothetical protein
LEMPALVSTPILHQLADAVNDYHR